MNIIYPILLAGGSGTRLWPLSRKSYPKQFSKLIGDKSLFQETALRLMSSDKIQFASHITVTNSDFRFIVKEQLQKIEINNCHILIEPEMKNTAPAILAASIFAQFNDPEAILLVCPSDHVIKDKINFHRAISVGLSQVQNGKIVTFGVEPKYPETGYGYIELEEIINNKDEASKVINFFEKPEKKFAEKMLETKKFQWNAGIFLFKAKDMLEAFKKYAPETLDLVSEAVSLSKKDLYFLRLDPLSWSKLQDISIDYAIMENAQNLMAVPLSSKWSDLGDWDSIWSESVKDHLDNSTSDNASALNCSNTLLRSESSGQQIVGIGLDNIIAIAMPDAVLVASKEKAQDVKKAVNLLKSKNINQATIFPKHHRPWGWFESLVLGERFQVKRIFINSGASLSLQSHQHRSEHWIVVKGTAKVTINQDVKIITEGESVFVPAESIHRIENQGQFPVVLIEIQIGSYLGEDDIIRYDDIYARA